jgi:hypothetical protein
MFLTTSCNKILCGSLDEKRQVLIDNAIETYQENIKVEVIPCENYYLNIYLKMESVDSVMIKDLNSILYNSKEGIGWQSIHVYSIGGKFLFDRHFNGMISETSPNW